MRGYALYSILKDEYEILNVKIPGFYLTNDKMYYVVPITFRPFCSEFSFLSGLSVNSSGLICCRETHNLAKFYPADFPRLYTEMFS